MHFTDFQKRIIKGIEENLFNDVYTFITYSEIDGYGGSSKVATNFGSRHVNAGDRIFIIRDENDAIEKLKNLKIIWNWLEENKYIASFNARYDNRWVDYFSSEETPQRYISGLLDEFYGKEIIVLPKLKDFVARGLLTDEEYFHNEEKKKWREELDAQIVFHNNEQERSKLQLFQQAQALSEERDGRNISLKWTRFIAISSVVIGLGTAIFQYMTYKTEREVIIKNIGAFRDTTVIRIVEQPKDTLSVRVTNKLNESKKEKTTSHP